jgi:hypothetical protein
MFIRTNLRPFEDLKVKQSIRQVIGEISPEMCQRVLPYITLATFSNLIDNFVYHFKLNTSKFIYARDYGLITNSS